MAAIASGTLSATNATSAWFSGPGGTPSAPGVVSVQVMGATGSNSVKLLRSFNGGTTYAPLAVSEFLNPNAFAGGISFDITEVRSGATYALQCVAPGNPVTWEAW